MDKAAYLKGSSRTLVALVTAQFIGGELSRLDIPIWLRFAAASPVAWGVLAWTFWPLMRKETT